MLLKKLFRTLWQYKAQFISMVIMVALGIGVFFGFNVEWYSLEVNTTEIYDATGFADFRIYSDKGFSPEDLEAFKAYTEHKLGKLEKRLDKDECRDIFWHIYGNPVVAKLETW